MPATLSRLFFGQGLAVRIGATRTSNLRPIRAIDAAALREKSRRERATSPEREAVSGGQESPERITLGSEDYFRVIEERRRAAEGVLWQLPSISLAAQTFLLSAGLSSDAEPSSQIVVGLLGIAAVFGTGLFVVYQALRADIFRRWLGQMVCQPLAPDELAIKGLELSDREIRRMERVFKAFPVACGGALLAFLAADVYVLGQGAGCW